MVLGFDLGSNTLRACVMKPAKTGFEIVKSSERIVGSARGLVANKPLQNDAKERILRALGEILEELSDLIYERNLDFENTCARNLGFENTCAQNFKNAKFSLPYAAVATEAFRVASDSVEFFEKIYKEFCVKFSIIDGETETNLTRLGIENRLQFLGIMAQNAVSIDLGGASTEISSAEFGQSFKFGIVRFCNENPGILQNFNYTNFSQIANEQTRSAREFLRSFGAGKIVLTSGVPTTISALKLGICAKDYDAGKINGSVLRFSDFAGAIGQILKFSKRKADEAMGENRAEVIVAGALLLEAILSDFSGSGADFIVVDDGLREGVCINLMQNLAIKN
ncbi:MULTISPECIES: Ppx/GppA phosphatase family protein [unclassified Campylobacter]|uniref:Ppx/GppA phosphatase family protein n=1 Tax=unclassified Campylobacter TaxID=2593542 RepID=UPI0022E9AA5C|nr:MULTISPECIES: disulfide bond formation protein DsbA [unclassified Campylobacter]MDA3054032.1 disulfide bond formation protein DsbA [Campylobacter sp. VBCF_07 NA4]MDA3060081.1 disulfide bond formation protein DsbA [Campylobacter sp. VBCF_02 NA5]MDA3069595.1 disulfide bond formation protein DsbA [Campylobacter sp. VBCF_08 NA3]WBR55069.1 disulfide bond formation protein DsbA [Campylobacter sp. VBCF_01 NA2]